MEFDADLLVIGLGPAGDVLAALARMAGLSVIGIDAEAAIYPRPRAAVFDHEVMRIFQMAGVAKRIEPLCRVPDRYQFVTADGDILLDFPLNQTATVSGWAESYLLHQPAVEAVLRARLVELDVDVRLGTKMTAIAETGAGVTCDVHGPAGGQKIRARYAVACDGASSPVRQALNIGLFDYAFDEPWLVIDASTDEPGDLPQKLLQICDPRRPVTYMKMCGNRYRWEFMIKPGEDSAQIASEESIHALLEPWHCVDRLVIERRAVYQFHGLIAKSWRAGRILLAGDAAHQMPPFAGQGMCSSIRDAANLAWKLADVINDRADAGLLDTYQTEREPHVRAIVETAIAMGRVVCLLDEQAAAARNAGMLARKAAGEEDISLRYPDLRGGMLMDMAGAGSLFPQPNEHDVLLDDVLGPDAWLIGNDLPGFEERGVKRVPLNGAGISGFAPALQDWLDAHDAQSVLVRPDRHVFGAGHPADVLKAWREMKQPLF